MDTFKPLQTSLKTELNSVFEGLGNHIGFVADAAQNCGKNMSEENIRDLQSTLYGVFNHVLVKIANREIPASKFVSTPLLLQDSTEASAERPSKKPKTAETVKSSSEGETSPSPTYLLNFDHAKAVSFLSKKYPEKNPNIIREVARIFCSGNMDLMALYVVKKDASYHRGFIQNPAPSLNEEERKDHHVRCAWSLLSGCAVISDPVEALSLFFSEDRASKKTKHNFGSFFFAVKHKLYIQGSAVKKAFLQLANLELDDFKSRIASETYDSAHEDSENDDIFANETETFDDLEFLDLGIEHGGDEASITELTANENPVHFGGNTLEKSSVEVSEPPSVGAEAIDEKRPKGGGSADKLFDIAAGDASVLLSPGDEASAEKNKKMQGNGTSSPAQTKKRLKVMRLSSPIRFQK